MCIRDRNRPAASRLLYSGASKDADFTENKMNRVQTGCSYIPVSYTHLDVYKRQELKNPITTASGTFGFGHEYGEFFDLSQLGGIGVKGLTPTERLGLSLIHI